MNRTKLNKFEYIELGSEENLIHTLSIRECFISKTCWKDDVETGRIMVSRNARLRNTRHFSYCEGIFGSFIVGGAGDGRCELEAISQLKGREQQGA